MGTYQMSMVRYWRTMFVTRYKHGSPIPNHRHLISQYFEWPTVAEAYGPLSSLDSSEEPKVIDLRKGKTRLATLLASISSRIAAVILLLFEQPNRLVLLYPCTLRCPLL